MKKLAKFTDGSGVISALDSKVTMSLNECGFFEEDGFDWGSKKNEPNREFLSIFDNGEFRQSEAQRLFSKGPNQYDERLGLYRSLFVGHVEEGNFRASGSSGGIGTWITVELMRAGKVDHVIHVKECISGSDTLFEYGVSSSVDEVISGAKTKYYPVEMSKVLATVKRVPGRYAVVGIPSFICALRRLCSKESFYKTRLKYFVGLIAGHQKSARFADYMGWQVGIKPGDLRQIDFRHKLEGRPADEYGIKMTGYVNGVLKTFVRSKKDLIGQDWGMGFFKCPASDYTNDVFNETADIVIGDAWLPKFKADHAGSNVVIVRSAELHELLSRAGRDKRIHLEESSVAEIFQSQEAHYKHTKVELPFRYNRLARSKLGKKYALNPISTKIGFSRSLIQMARLITSYKSSQIYVEAVQANDISYFNRKMKKYIIIYRLAYYVDALIRRLRIIKSNVAGLL